MSKKGFSQFKEYEDNPFLADMKMNVSRRTVALTKDHYVVNPDGMVMEHTATMAMRMPVEKTGFIKLFRVPFWLTGSSIKLFLYLLGKIKYGETKVYFNPRDDHDLLGLSIKSIYRSLGELAGEAIIAKAGGHWLHINPAFGFRGSRLNINKQNKQ